MTEIYLAFRDRSDSLPAVVDAARAALSPDEARIQRQLVLDAATDGMATAGDLLDHVERLAPAERRALLDRTRARAGLPPLSESRKTAPQPVEEEPERDELGACYPVCHEPGCRAFPVDSSTGAPQRSRAKRWRCSLHAAGHEADMADWVSPITIGPSGLRDLDAEEVEALAQRREAERHRLQHEQRRAAAAAALPGIERAEAAEAAFWQSANLPVERTAP